MVSHDADNNYVQQVDEVRHKFFEVFKDNIQKDVYDKRDLERLRLENDYVCSFLRHQAGSVEKASEMVDVSLRWRKELAVNDLTEQTFPRALHEAGIIFYHNYDKNGHPILHIAVARFRKDLFQLILAKQLLAWHIEKVFLQHPGRRIVVLLDMTNAGLSNVDIDLIKFQVRCFTTYYPAILAYMLVFEMPWVLNAIWNIIKKLLNAEQQRHVLLVKKPQMLQYIDRDQLFVHMGGSDDYKYSFIPSEDSGIEVTLRESDCESLVSSCEQSTLTTLKKRVTFSEFPKSVSFDCVDHCDVEDRASYLVKLTNSADSSVYHGSLANISPSERLTFFIDSCKGDAVSHITISNVSQHKLSFKVKTTSPDVYRVKPHTGILAVKDQIEITIVLPNGHLTSDTKDKFLVMLLTLKDDINENNHESLNSLWKKVSKDSEDYMEHRLMCDKVRNEKTTSTKVDHEYTSPTSPTSLVEKVEMLLTRQQEITEQLNTIIFLLKILFVFLFVVVFLMIQK